MIQCCSKRANQRTELEIQLAINLILAKDGPFFRSLRREKISSEDPSDGNDKRSPADKARVLIENAKVELLLRVGNKKQMACMRLSQVHSFTIC